MGPIHQSRADRLLDVALACAGTYTCSGVTGTENGDLDKRIENLCRIGTDETVDSKSWNEFMARPLLDEEGSILTFESCATTPLDDGTSADSHTRGDSEISKGIADRTQIFVHTIRREETEEVKKLDLKTKPSWIPLLKMKLKHNLKEAKCSMQLCSIGLSKMTLGMKSKGKAPNSSNNEVPSRGHKTMKKKFGMPLHSWKPLERKGFDSSMFGFEVSRIGTNHVSIIDRSLLQSHKVTPAVQTAIIDNEPPSLRKHDNRDKAKLPVRIFDSSPSSDHLFMPSINAKPDRKNKNDDCSASISAKPASFVDVLDEEATQSTLSSCVGGDIHSIYEEKEMHNSPKDDLVIEETNSNGDSSHFEVMYKIRAPYKISRDAKYPGC